MISKIYQKIAIVTGANGGIGYGICQRLLETEGDSITLVMACRNPSRAANAKEKLLLEFPSANIDIELVDVGSVKSVMYPHVNYLFCNAGILTTLGVNWKLIFYLLFTDPIGLLERSDATIQPIGEINEDGMGKVFACNVFGHYVMMRELENLLEKSGDGRVIWTSSITADSKSFNIEDWQGIQSKEPYESSKWACDIISIALSERFVKEEKHISSFTTSPGVVASDIGELPQWITNARTLAHYLFRFIGVASQTITSYNGAVADIYAALQPLNKLSFVCRYGSLCSRWGTSYVRAFPIKYDRYTAEKLIGKCELAYQAYKNNLTAPVN
ncbi:hypothetical protein BD770DRAFT_317288 [Pilaira anomala]|nr:hypothetical protein BD770DRAFT_317288 [Pilaira anomala]